MMSDRAPRLHKQLAAWAAANPIVEALHIFGSRARDDFRPDSDLDIALEIKGRFSDLTHLVDNRAKWKRELTELTGIVVKDIQLRSDPEVSEPVMTIFRRQRGKHS